MKTIQKKHIERLIKKHKVFQIPEDMLVKSLVRLGITHKPKDAAYVMTNQSGKLGIYFSYTGNSDKTYIGAMHEFGHIANQHEATPWVEHCLGIVSDELLKKEVEAWEWAFANSVTPINDTMVLHMLNSLFTYTFRWAEIDGQSEFSGWRKILAETWKEDQLKRSI